MKEEKKNISETKKTEPIIKEIIKEISDKKRS
jgi:hypothetical protein